MTNYTQYSKKLATGVMIFWAVVRILAMFIVYIRGDCTDGLIRLVNGVDDIAMVNVLAYTGNSVSEKVASGYFNMKARNMSSCETEEESEEEKG